MDTAKRLFITGMARSGTTLLQRVVNSFPESSIFEQPMPLFFRYAKGRFLKENTTHDTYYVLSDYFNESQYRVEDFLNFLKSHKISNSKIQSEFKEMAKYSGNISKIDISQLENKKYLFKEAVSEIIDLNTSDELVLGFKEILCEEFIPELIDDWKCLLIVRNPLDVLTSIQFGKGEHYTGQRRPTLFHVRNWRKSVAFAAMMHNHKNFKLIRYEDLILNFSDSLKSITEFLELEHENNSELLTKESIQEWGGNSSFDTLKDSAINKSSYENYKKKMPDSMVKYISYLCSIEMKYLGYSTKEMDGYNPTDLKEPFNIDSLDFDQEYSIEKNNLILEEERISLLREANVNNFEKSRFFLNEKVYSQYKSLI